MRDAICSDCGKVVKVPFEPVEVRPDDCRNCYSKHKAPTKNSCERQDVKGVLNSFSSFLSLTSLSQNPQSHTFAYMFEKTGIGNYGSVLRDMSYGNRNSGGYGGNRGGYGGSRGGGFGGSSSYNSGPKPVEAGKEYDVEITELSRRGDGVAKIGGFVIFVKNSKVGQKVKIKIDSVGPRFAIASVVGGSETKAEGASESRGSDAGVAESV